MKNKKNFEVVKLLKKNIRKKIQKKRDTLTTEYREKSSKLIAEKFFSTAYYNNSKNILIYYPFRSEVDTTLIIKEALKDKKDIILPRVFNDKLEFYFVNNPSKQLEKGAYDIMEPITSLCKPAKISDIDLVVVPGVSFDKNLNRLGYGGGYYDKILSYLPQKVKKIALCFDIQVINSIPVSEHDIKVDMLITETKIYDSLKTSYYKDGT